MRRIYLAVGVFVLAIVALAAKEWDKFTDVRVVGHITKPAEVEPTDQRIKGLKLPPGFTLSKFADGLENPRMIAVSADGSVYVTRRDSGDCVMLRDTNGDGRADQRTVVARKEKLHGIALDGDRAYFATVKEVYTAERRNDGTFGELKQIISDLPDGGQHPNRTLAVGPDRKLYISVGSTCNACDETNPEHATMLRAELDGSSREVFASGLRNTVGFAWHPETREFWGMDHNIDWLGDDEHGEELNLLVRGAKYGWPFVYDRGKFNPADEPPNGKTHAEWAKESREPLLLYSPHAAPMQMAFYTGEQFPQDYRNDAFVAMRGSWNRRPPIGYEVVRIRFDNGKPAKFEPFLSGFLVQEGSKWGHFGRPVGLAVMPDGSLLVGDDTKGVIYRVVYGR